MKKQSKRIFNYKKGLVSALIVFALFLSLPFTEVQEVYAASGWEFTSPTTSLAVQNPDGTRYLKTTAQRAASEVPLILGLNVVGTTGGTNMLWGAGFDVAGTNVNTNPDPYVWNYKYVTDKGGSLSQNMYMHRADSGVQSTGIFQSGGANEVITAAHEEWGGVSVGIYNRADLFLGYNDALVEQVDLVRGFEAANSEYYQPGDEDYKPMFLDVQTGSAVSRAYAWTDMAKVINKYISESDGKVTTRYGDPLITATNLEQFSFGITYYIRSLIDEGSLKMKEAAFVTKLEDGSYTVKKPDEMGDVRSDCFAVGNIVDWKEGKYTIAQLAELDLIVIADSLGYSYTGGATGSTVEITNKATFLSALHELNPTKVPMVLETSKCITPGSNGFNYSPITPTFIPYIHAYLYMDQLKSVDSSINPIAMFRFSLEELYHVKADQSANVALYYIEKDGKWLSLEPDLDIVPDTINYVYDKEKIKNAIVTGIDYAVKNQNNSDTYLLAAYRITDPIYKVATGESTWQEVLSPTYLAQYTQKELADMLEDYKAHMNKHPWKPDRSINGTYGYVSGSDGSGGGGGGGAQQPEEDKKVTEESTPPGKVNFKDVTSGAWYYENIMFLAEQGLISGKTANSFAPNDNITRAEFVQILFNMAKATGGNGTASFKDVKADAWYFNAVAWGSETGIVVGDNNQFRPNDKISRQEMAVLLDRYVAEIAKASLNKTADKVTFEDDNQISSWAKASVENMQRAGVINGIADNGGFKFAAQANATRAEAATMIAILVKLI